MGFVSVEPSFDLLLRLLWVVRALILEATKLGILLLGGNS